MWPDRDRLDLATYCNQPKGVLSEQNSMYVKHEERGALSTKNASLTFPYIQTFRWSMLYACRTSIPRKKGVICSPTFLYPPPLLRWGFSFVYIKKLRVFEKTRSCYDGSTRWSSSHPNQPTQQEKQRSLAKGMLPASCTRPSSVHLLGETLR